jgi:hypothetical protein
VSDTIRLRSSSPLSSALHQGTFASAFCRIREGRVCASACVFSFAAGLTKLPAGSVLIHRPYFIQRPSGSIDAAMKKAFASSRAYFAEMNVPENLADLILLQCMSPFLAHRDVLHRRTTSVAFGKKQT